MIQNNPKAFSQQYHSALICLSLITLLFTGICHAQEKKIIDVPYKTQPNAVSCQATCLKMVSMYYSPLSSKEISNIYTEVNEGSERPSTTKNSWANITWWLNKNLAPKKFTLFKTKDEAEAIEYIVKCIKAGSPVIMSTNNFRTDGHLILIVGFTGYRPNQSSPDLKFVCHDPYGKFFPELFSDLYGANRYDFGMSLPDGSEVGVGKGVLITPQSLKRFRDDKHHKDYFVMIGNCPAP